MKIKPIFLEIIIGLLFFICIRCSDNTYEEKLKIQLRNKFPKELKYLNAIVVLPNQGCIGCISEAENFMISNANKKNLGIKYVVTKIMSRKILNQKLGDSIYFSKALFIDSLNIFSTVGDKYANYPAILYLKNGDFKSIEFQCPDNPNAMSNLLEYIKNIGS
jgi:hypothetical protein